MAKQGTTAIRKAAMAWADEHGWQLDQKKPDALLYRDDEHDRTVVLHFQDDWEAAALWMRLTFADCISMGSRQAGACFYIVAPDEAGCRERLDEHQLQRALSRVSFALVAADGSISLVPPPPEPDQQPSVKDQAKLGIWPPVLLRPVVEETKFCTFAPHA